MAHIVMPHKRDRILDMLMTLGTLNSWRKLQEDSVPRECGPGIEVFELRQFTHGNGKSASLTLYLYDNGLGADLHDVGEAS